MNLYVTKIDDVRNRSWSLKFALFCSPCMKQEQETCRSKSASGLPTWIPLRLMLMSMGQMVACSGRNQYGCWCVSTGPVTPDMPEATNTIAH